MNTTLIKAGTKKAESIMHEWDYYKSRHRDIYDAYGRPSSVKVRTFKDIESRARETDGYNHDLTVTGAGSSFYSTMYSYTDAAGTHIIKDTYANIYELII